MPSNPDTSFTLQIGRLERLLSIAEVDGECPSTDLSDFHHFSAPSLPFLLAIFCQPTANFPPPNCKLLVIDSLSNIFSAAFSNKKEDSDKAGDQKSVEEARQWASKRRWAILEDLSQRLQKLAAVHDMAVLILNQTATRLRHDTGVMLQSALSSQAFENRVKNRVVVYHDWFDGVGTVANWTSHGEEHTSTLGGAIVMKANGLRYRYAGRPIVFVISTVIDSSLSRRFPADLDRMA